MTDISFFQQKKGKKIEPPGQDMKSSSMRLEVAAALYHYMVTVNLLGCFCLSRHSGHAARQQHQQTTSIARYYYYCNRGCFPDRRREPSGRSSDWALFKEEIAATTTSSSINRQQRVFITTISITGPYISSSSSS
jgi:hypothetical protein